MFGAYIILSFIVPFVLIGLNVLLSNNNSYTEKDGPFECGFTSYQQTRSAYNVQFILVAILFLPFDLEISTMLPYVTTALNNSSYGLIIFIIFLTILVLSFILEILIGAINIQVLYQKVSKPLISSLIIFNFKSTLNY